VNIKDQVYVEYAGLRGLFEVLRADGYQTVGPRLCNRFVWIFGPKYGCAGYQDVGAGISRELSGI
jgi:hypothetical protein